MTPSVTGVEQRGTEAGPAADRHSRGEEREHRHGEARRDRPDRVFEQFGGRLATSASMGDREPQDDAGHGCHHGRQHAAGVD